MCKMLKHHAQNIETMSKHQSQNTGEVFNLAIWWSRRKSPN